jgi:cysteinyl-tRNA synthetase
MPLALYDSLRRATVPFETRDPGRAAVYVCGPTVYGDAHIGHGRFAVVFDVLNRYLRHRGLDVTFVMNITDVDDKIIARSHQEGVSPFRIADRYTRRWNRSMDLLGVRPPDVQPLATGHILEMQALIGRLLEQDKAYLADGNVLFRVRSFPDYGKLSNRRLEDAQQPADVAEVAKQDPVDFALWKAAKPGEPSWPSPWGQGRPGWHIECSAMAATHLGGGFDIHGGGVDLVFPHHENEIAQYEAAHGEPFARHWMHNGMLRMADAKMARSVGNVISIDAALARWGRGPLRVWYASAAYRSPLTFSDSLLDEASIAFERIVTFVRHAEDLDGGGEADVATAERHEIAFGQAMDDDLNLPGGLAALHDAVNAGNDRLGRADAGDAEARAAVVALGRTVKRLADEVLGLGIEETLRPARRLGARIAPLVDDLLERRQRARSDRDFATADAIRDALGEAGVVVEDRPGGARWYVAPEPPDGQLRAGGDEDVPEPAAAGVDAGGEDAPTGGLPTAEI